MPGRPGERETAELDRLNCGARGQEGDVVRRFGADRVRVEERRLPARGDDAHRLHIVELVDGRDLLDGAGRASTKSGNASWRARRRS